MTVVVTVPDFNIRSTPS